MFYSSYFLGGKKTFKVTVCKKLVKMLTINNPNLLLINYFIEVVMWLSLDNFTSETDK